MRNILRNEIINNNFFFVFLSIFMVIVTFMAESTIDRGVFEFSKILFGSLMPLFFILIISFIFEIVSYKIISNKILVVIIKSLLFSFVPFGVSLTATLNLETGIFNNFYPSTTVLFFISLYWFLLTTASIIWLKRKAIIVLLLFSFSPGISDLLEHIPLKEYFPFKIVMTILGKIATNNSIDIVASIILIAYMVSLVIIIKQKKV